MASRTINDWLNDLGLPQYIDLFRENGVDLDVLGELTDDHLKEMGVSVLGHRLKIVQGIARLGRGPERRRTSDALGDVATAERRHLTIMFCDLVGSTAISSRLDPEDYRDLMTLYQETVTGAVSRAGGHVAKYLGDGVLIYFGYPIAQEDAAERAWRAGFEIVEAVARLAAPGGGRLQVRIGLATGIVVVGDLYGEGVSEASAVAGETPNLAARLQGLAGPGQIVIGDKTRALLGDLFVYEALENVDLKGFEPGQSAWRVLSERREQDRLSLVRGRETMTPLVGRGAERERLLAAWEDAKAGRGRVFLISGEAGIGKSRLAHELLDRAGSDDALVLHYQSAPYFANTAFYPIRRQIESLLGFSDEESPTARLDKLDRTIKGDEARALIASLLSLPTDRYPPLNLSAALQKSRLIDALIEQVVLRSERRPVVLHFEDLHWTDPSSLELLGRFIDRLTDRRILLLATYRPEFIHDWTGDHVQICTLSRLDNGDLETLLDRLTRGRQFSAEQRRQLLDRSDGVPLFAEELTRAVLEGETGSGAENLVPESLQDSLMARLDRLGDSRDLAQIGAAIGREFDADLLSRTAARPLAEVRGALEQLVEADLLLPPRDGRTWIFRHALLQEAAYRSMLRRRRQGLHARIAETLEREFPDRCRAGPEQVATHLVAAGQGGRSVPYWLTAGRTAWQRASMKEALSHLQRGLDFVAQIPDPAARARQELELQSTLGVVHFAATSYASEQAQAAFERARDLFASVDDVDLRVAVLYGIGAFETMRGDVLSGHETFARLSEEAARSGNPRYEAYSASMQAWSHFNRGHFADCLRNGERVLALFNQGVWDKPGPRLSAANPKVISECFRAAALWALGYPDQAVAAGNGALEYARSLSDKYSLVYALANGVIRIHDWTGNWDAVLTLTEECGRVAGEYGYGFLGLWASIWRARAIAQQGDVEEAERMTASAVAACKTAGVHYHRVCFEAYQARLLLMSGRVEEAASLAGGLDEPLARGGEASHAVDLALVKAEIAAAQGDRDAAHAQCRGALRIASDQSAPSLQLRAALSLAPLLPCPVERSALIAPILSRFTEGFETKDLIAARALV